MDVFCERCGTLQPKPEATAPRSAGVLARRVLDAVGITESHTRPVDDWLRLCLNCRGYSCPTCWNESEGVCQTCAPLPEPVVPEVLAAEPEAAPAVLDVPPPYARPYLPEAVVYPPAPEPVYVAPPEPVYVAPPEPVYVAPPEPEPVVFVEPAPEPAPPVFEPEPVVFVEPAPEPAPPVFEPEPVVFVEPAPEPAPEPAMRPVPPRMPILPLPPPPPRDAPILPLPPLPAYPVAPQIAFNEQVSAAASMAAAAPAYQPHALLAPPPEASHSASAGLRPCGSCQLTLSARAHFCRRCGTAQPN